MDRAELDRLAVRHIDRLRAAIEKGKKEEALPLLEEYAKGKDAFHDYCIRYINLLLGFIAKEHGDMVVQDLHMEMESTWRSALIREWEAGGANPDQFPLDDFIRARSRVWDLFHDNVFHWEEDAEKYTQVLEPCEAGGMLLETYGEKNPARSTEVNAYTLNRPEGFQHYCMHCTAFYEFGPREREGGKPLMVFEPPRKPGEPCRNHIYKDLSKIPVSYFKERPLPAPRSGTRRKPGETG